MFWMHAYTLRGQVGGGWALEFASFLVPVIWHRADRRGPFGACGAPSGRVFSYLLMCKYQSDRELQFSRCSDIGQSFAPIGLHKTDDASDWLLIK
jgi:hypothetical protein